MLYLFIRIWRTEGIAQCFITYEESAQESYTRLAAVATGIERLKLRGELEWFSDIIESRTKFVAGVRRREVNVNAQLVNSHFPRNDDFHKICLYAYGNQKNQSYICSP